VAYPRFAGGARLPVREPDASARRTGPYGTRCYTGSRSYVAVRVSYGGGPSVTALGGVALGLMWAIGAAAVVRIAVFRASR
jgi:hypothetical protein